MFFHLLKTYWNELRGKHPVWIKEEDTFSYYADQHAWIRFGMVCILWALLSFFLVAFDKPLQRVVYQDDKTHAANTIVADFPFHYPDLTATEELRRIARESSPVCLTLQISHNVEIVKNIIETFKRVPQGRYEVAKWLKTEYAMDEVLAEGLSKYIQYVEFQQILVLSLESRLHQGFVSADFSSQFPSTRPTQIMVPPDRILAENPMSEIATIPVIANSVARDALRRYVGTIEQSVREALVLFVSLHLEKAGSDLVYNEALTAQRLQEREGSVENVMQRVQSGENIISRGQLITIQDLEKLHAYNEANQLNNEINITICAKAVLAALIVLFIGAIFVKSSCPEIFRSSRKLLTYIVIIMMGVSVNTFLIYNIGSLSDFTQSSLTSIDLVCWGLAPILATITLGVRPGLSAGLLISLITAMQFGNSYSTFLAGIIVSCVVCFFVVNAENYRNFFSRVFFPTLITLLILRSMLLLYNDQFLMMWRTMLIGAFASTMLTAVLSLLMLFVLEWLLGVTTNMSLFALTSVSHPILKELQLLAPGTYHHCVNVETIAEQAAMEVGANPIMCRVLALYHDIGKLANPGYFVENIPADRSPHRQISPNMSAMIIRGHVSEGIDRAITYKLPSVVRDVIAQHHGTDLVYFFYQKALSESENGIVDESSFRYPGPLPQQKEVVIVSLADACEAATRSLERPTHAKIEALVSEIFNKRLKNGQLDKADLTFKEFSLVLDSFVKTLTAMYHGRIAYPKANIDSDDLFQNTVTNDENQPITPGEKS